MTRKKHWFQDFRQKELDWGLNIRDSANEIENKQFIKLENFNFKGNKLVNSKAFELAYDVWGTTWIKGILEEDWDIWFVHNAQIYKNWVLQSTLWLSLPDRRYNMTLWNDILYLTSEEKDDTSDDWVYVLQWNTVSQLSYAATGWPRYNTIYNWKLILGWYNNTPNAVLHSQTWSVSDPTLTFNFGTYNAGSALVWDGSKVTGFKVWEKWMWVFKENEVWYTNSEKDTWTTFDFIYEKETSTWNLNQNTITDVQQETFFYDPWTKAVRRLGYEENVTTLRDVAISREVEPIFENIAENQDYATSSFKYPNYKLFLRSKNSWANVNDICLVYNVDRKSWAIETDKLVTVSTKGFLWSPFEWKIWEDDKWVWTEWEAITKEFDFGDAVDYERFWEVEVAGRMDETLTLYVDFYAWGELKRTVEINTKWVATGTLGTKTLGTSILGWDFATSWLVPFKERMNLYYDWQNCNIGFRYSGLGEIEIHDYNIQHKRLKWYKHYS